MGRKRLLLILALFLKLSKQVAAVRKARKMLLKKLI
jgi:hypothetical protein